MIERDDCDTVKQTKVDQCTWYFCEKSGHCYPWS